METGTVDDDLTAPGIIRRLLADGFIHLFYNEGRIIYVVPDEVRAAYGTLDTKRIRTFKEIQDMLDGHARAAVNLYGVLERKEFLRLINRHIFDGKVAGLDADPYDAFLEDYDGRLGDYTGWKEYLVSREFLDDNGNVLPDMVTSLLRSREGKPRYDPGREALLKYTNPNHYEETPQTAALRNALLRFGVPERTIRRVLDDLHGIIAGEDESGAMFRVLEENQITLEPGQLQTALRLITDVSSHTRLWSNYGHTPAEIAAMKSGVRRAAADAGMRLQPAVMGAQAAPEGNIPRNGPCPCGSGKKYKHCCGRGR